METTATPLIKYRKTTNGAIVEEQPVSGSTQPMTPEEFALRVRQQEILTELGLLALKGTPFQELLDHTTRLATEGLRAEFGKVLEYLPGENRLLVRAGVGWGPDVVGSATVGADSESPAGFALRTGAPVISNHLENEERFRTPELLVEYGIHRAMNVILQGDGSPFGVLEVDTRKEGAFRESDIPFLQGAANLLGMAIERQRIDRELRIALDRHQLLLREVNHRINNSLQIVGSMLQLQGRSTTSAEVKRHLRDASNRITAIARAHQRLYKTDEFTTLNLGNYLSEICADFTAATPGCEIEISAPPMVLLKVDRAITVAILLNELITNAAKYAYPSGPCRIWVTLRAAANAVTLSVRDEGAGLPENFDPALGNGLGMRLVSAFCNQLAGTLTIERRKPGTEFLISIPLDATPPTGS